MKYELTQIFQDIFFQQVFLPVGIWFGVDVWSVRRWPLLAVPVEADPTSPPAVFAPPTADPYAEIAAAVELNDAGWVWPK